MRHHTRRLSGCGGCLHPTVHSGGLPLLSGSTLSLSSILPSFARWRDLPSRCSRCATPQAVVVQCLCTSRSPAQNNPLYFLPWGPCSNQACVSISSTQTPEPTAGLASSLPTGLTMEPSALPASPLKPGVLPSAFHSGSKERSYILIYFKA